MVWSHYLLANWVTPVRMSCFFSSSLSFVSCWVSSKSCTNFLILQWAQPRVNATIGALYKMTVLSLSKGLSSQFLYSTMDIYIMLE